MRGASELDSGRAILLRIFRCGTGRVGVARFPPGDLREFATGGPSRTRTHRVPRRNTPGARISAGDPLSYYVKLLLIINYIV